MKVLTQLAIIQLLETGFLTVPFHPEFSLLFFTFWITYFLGIILQMLLFKKSHRRGRFLMVNICALGLFFAEILCQIITGWELLAAMSLYALFLTLLLGCVSSFLWQHLRKKHQ